MTSSEHNSDYAHLTICIAPDGSLDTYPEGDPQQIVQALHTLVRILTEHPEAALCIARACEHGDHAPDTVQ